MYRAYNFFLKTKVIQNDFGFEQLWKICLPFPLKPLQDSRTWQSHNLGAGREAPPCSMMESGPHPQIMALWEPAVHSAPCPGPLWMPEGGEASPGGGVLLFFLLVRVAADGDDADRGAGGVGNNNRLPLPLPGGAGGSVAPAAGDGGAAGRAAVHQGTAGRRVLLDALGPLRGADGLRGGHLTGGDIPVTTKHRARGICPSRTVSPLPFCTPSSAFPGAHGQATQT